MVMAIHVPEPTRLSCARGSWRRAMHVDAGSLKLTRRAEGALGLLGWAHEGRLLDALWAAPVGSIEALIDY